MKHLLRLKGFIILVPKRQPTAFSKLDQDAEDEAVGQQADGAEGHQQHDQKLLGVPGKQENSDRDSY